MRPLLSRLSYLRGRVKNAQKQNSWRECAYVSCVVEAFYSYKNETSDRLARLSRRACQKMRANLRLGGAVPTPFSSSQDGLSPYCALTGLCQHGQTCVIICFVSSLNVKQHLPDVPCTYFIRVECTIVPSVLVLIYSQRYCSTSRLERRRTKQEALTEMHASSFFVVTANLRNAARSAFLKLPVT